MSRRATSNLLFNNLAGRSGFLRAFAGINGDGGPATEAGIGNIYTVAVGLDGSVYTADVDDDRIRKIGTDGIIRTIAGTGVSGYSGDGGPAVEASMAGPMDPHVAPDGTIYFGDWYNHVIRRIGTDGIITTVAGGPDGQFPGTAGPAMATPMGYPASLAIGRDGSLFVATGSADRVLRIGPAMPALTASDSMIASDDGGELYVFDSSRRHQRTVDPLTGQTLATFGYDAGGRLATIADGDGNQTRIERDGSLPAAIVAPGGQRTSLDVDGNGYLAAVTNEAGESWRMSHTAAGLLTSFTDPRGGERTMQYDAEGRLTRDANPAQGSWTIARAGAPGDETVTLTSAEGRTQSYRTEDLPDGGERRTNTDAAGLVTTMTTDAGGTTTTAWPDGSTEAVVPDADPRWGMQSRFAKSITFRTPGGLTSTTTVARSVELGDPANPLSGNFYEDVYVNGRWYEWYHDRAANVGTYWTPLNRWADEQYDGQGRTISWTPNGVLGVQYGYDPKGRLTTIAQGTRQATIAYDTRNRPVTFTDPMQHSVTFGYDDADRITSQTLPDGRVIGFSYDANGNVIQVVPPGRPGHLFSYTPVDLTQGYVPPAVPGTGATVYTYNKDQQLTRVDRPGGDAIVLDYDTGGRLGTVTFDAGSIRFGYHQTGQVQSIAAPGVGLAYTFDGPLPLTSTWSGGVTGVVGHTYTNDFTVSTESVNGAAVSFGYDDDGLLTQAGDLALARHPAHGLLTGTTLGASSDQYAWTGYGEPERYQAAHPASGSYPVFDAQYTRDGAGRLTQIVETVDTIQRVWAYEYDDSGRLTVVRRNGEVASAYAYDANGNRLAYEGDRGHEEGTYDDQDRVLTYGNATFTYAPNGELLTRTVGGQVTHYAYDALGNLRSVTQPDGTVIEYVVDGRGRRVGKKVDGTPVKGWLYADQLRIVAELDGSGGVVSRFVYGSKGNVPDYMVRGGVTYRIVSDHLGSPRVVLNADTGEVVQRMDFDPFGVVRQDTNPGFQPFGFAGGLYDRDTSLVRFGARDYDAVPGRWTAKDPIEFLGGSPNFMAYVFADPVNYRDPTGQGSVGAAIGGMAGAVVGGIVGSGVGTSVGAGSGTLVAPGVGTVGGAVVGGWQGAVAGAGAGGVSGAVLGDKIEDALNWLIEAVGISAQKKDALGSTCRREHTKGARPSTKERHEDGQARKAKDRSGEKGDARRPDPRRRPPNHKGPWPLPGRSTY